MKKTFAIIAILSLITLFACKKAAPLNGGSWTFKGVTYQSQFTDWVTNQYVAYTGSAIPTCTLSFLFYFPFDSNASAVHPRAGNYIITNGVPNDSLHISVTLTDSSATAVYYPTATAANSNIIATVTRLSNGELSITLPATEIAYGSDSGVLTANITYLK